MKIKLTLRISHKLEDGISQNSESKDIDTTELDIKEIEYKFLKYVKGFADKIAEQVDGFKIKAQNLEDFFNVS